MPEATRQGGPLLAIADCYVNIPSFGRINFDTLPDISDTKDATYNDESVIGRSSPLKTYANSGARHVSMQIHFVVSKPADVQLNLAKLRAIQSCTYPRVGATGAPFIPPPICRLKCGKLLSEDDLCVVLKNYSVKFPTEVAWDEQTFTPFKFDVDTKCEVVYRSADLPNQQRILALGR